MRREAAQYLRDLPGGELVEEVAAAHYRLRWVPAEALRERGSGLAWRGLVTEAEGELSQRRAFIEDGAPALLRCRLDHTHVLEEEGGHLLGHLGCVALLRQLDAHLEEAEAGVGMVTLAGTQPIGPALGLEQREQRAWPLVPQ